jgi:hypothetical protein
MMPRSPAEKSFFKAIAFLYRTPLTWPSRREEKESGLPSSVVAVQVGFAVASGNDLSPDDNRSRSNPAKQHQSGTRADHDDDRVTESDGTPGISLANEALPGSGASLPSQPKPTQHVRAFPRVRLTLHAGRATRPRRPDARGGAGRVVTPVLGFPRSQEIQWVSRDERHSRPRCAVQDHG